MATTQNVLPLGAIVGILAITAGSALADSAFFSPAPMTAGYNVPGRSDVQRFNGTFVARVISELSSRRDQACLKSIGESRITLTTYASGAVQISSPENCLQKTAALTTQSASKPTGEVTVSGIRVLGLLLADQHFNASPMLRHNDHDLSHYDVELYDAKGAIHIAFVPPPDRRSAVVTLGCPETGPIAVTYTLDPHTQRLRAGNMVC